MTDTVYKYPVVQSPVMSNSANSWTAACQASLSFIISQSLPKFMSSALVMPSSQLNLYCPQLLLPSIFPSIRDFSNESAVRIRWPKHWSFSFSISPSKEYSRLISLKTDWFDLLAVQGTLRSLHQDQSLKAPILWHSAFFKIQLSQLYVTTGKTITLTVLTFVSRVMSLLCNTLSRSNRLLISWLQLPPALILEPKKRKSVITSTFPLLCAIKKWGWLPLS